MRIGLISDIHGNLVSLEAVLEDIHRNPVDRLIFLGDLATLGPQPKEVVDRIRSLDCDCIMGNHDTYLFNPVARQTYSNEYWFTSTVEWCVDQLTTDDIDFIRTFSHIVEVTLDPGSPKASKLLCFHGSPRSNIDSILASTTNKALKKMFHGHEAAVWAGGHTHVQLMRQHKGRLIVNVGSVGLPFRQSPFKKTPRVLPWAEYAIVQWHAGSLSIDLRHVPIDLDKVKDAARQSDLPGKEEWIENWEPVPEMW